MRTLFLLAALILLATFAPKSFAPLRPPPEATWIRFEPVPLAEEPARASSVGGLVFLGGWHLTSNNYRFGGISAVHVQGRELLAMSDSGWAFSFPLPPAPAPVRAEERILQEGPGGRDAKASRDVESLVLSGNALWLGYEHANAVWRYDRRSWKARASAAPPAMARWRKNRGPEAMVRLADGRFLVFAEGSGGESEALLFDGDPALPGTASSHLRYRPPDGYRIVDAATLPDGRILFLNRRFRLLEGFSAKLTIGDLPPLKEGAIVGGEPLADFVAPVLRDNLEAISVTREGGRTIIWIASDDNYISRFQRTLLLKFALAEEVRPPRPRPAASSRFPASGGAP